MSQLSAHSRALSVESVPSGTCIWNDPSCTNLPVSAEQAGKPVCSASHEHKASQSSDASAKSNGSSSGVSPSASSRPAESSGSGAKRSFCLSSGSQFGTDGIIARATIVAATAVNRKTEGAKWYLYRVRMLTEHSVWNPKQEHNKAGARRPSVHFLSVHFLAVVYS
jgi:hypothetical protein